MNFARVEDTDRLGELRTLREGIKRHGAIWVIWPKGQRQIREDDVRRAALEAGLVDVKVVSFSDTVSRRPQEFCHGDAGRPILIPLSS